MSQNPDASPFNPLPPVIVALAVVIIGIEALFSLGARGLIGGPEAIGWRVNAIQNFGFINAIFDWMLTNRTWPAEGLVRLITYPLIHMSFMHALFVVVILLAIGNMVASVFSTLAILTLFFGSSISGAVIYGLLGEARGLLVGGYPAAYGLIGAYTFLLWVSLAATGGQQYRAFGLIGMLLAIQLVFGIFGGTRDWIADVAGFVTGFGLSFVVSPGGWQRVRAKMRGR